VLADDLERQVVVALQPEDEAQPLDVGRRELAVAGGRAHRRDELALLQEAQLAVAEVGELRLEPREHLADGEQVDGTRLGGASGGGAGHYPIASLARSTREA
jgi:hypothetical protein